MKNVVIKLTDDFDPSVEAVGTREFTWLGIKYIIDLGAENLDIMDELMAQYAAAARWADDQPEPKKRTKAPKAASRAKRDDIRAWAIRKGLEIGTRGRIKDSIIAEYEREMSAGS